MSKIKLSESDSNNIFMDKIKEDITSQITTKLLNLNFKFKTPNTFKKVYKYNSNNINVIVKIKASEEHLYECNCKLIFEYDRFEIHKTFPIYKYHKVQIELFQYWDTMLTEAIKKIWDLLT